MRKVHFLEGKFITITSLSAATMTLIIPYNNVTLCCGGIGWLIASGMLPQKMYEYDLSRYEQNEELTLKQVYWMHGLLGVIISPLFIVTEMVPYWVVTSVALIGGPIVTSYLKPSSIWTSALFTGLVGLVGMGFVNGLYFYPDLDLLAAFRLMKLHSDMYPGIFTAMCYSLYSTRKIINKYKNYERNHISHAVYYSMGVVFVGVVFSGIFLFVRTLIINPYRFNRIFP